MHFLQPLLSSWLNIFNQVPIHIYLLIKTGLNALLLLYNFFIHVKNMTIRSFLFPQLLLCFFVLAGIYGLFYQQMLGYSLRGDGRLCCPLHHMDLLSFSFLLGWVQGERRGGLFLLFPLDWLSSILSESIHELSVIFLLIKFAFFSFNIILVKSPLKRVRTCRGFYRVTLSSFYFYFSIWIIFNWICWFGGTGLWQRIEEIIVFFCLIILLLQPWKF